LEEAQLKKYLLCLAILVAALAPLATSGAAAARPAPQSRKACSAYDAEHFHGVTAHLPDGTKCLQSGEYCSHAPGFARAYREYGFVCRGRLEEI
jgi:hypothetical protein